MTTTVAPQLAAPMFEAAYIGDLGNGLIRRWSTAADMEKIASLTATVFRRNAESPLNLAGGDEVRIAMSAIFPVMGPDDWAVVEDTSRAGRPVVACCGLWRHQWSFGSVTFGVGRPENVATDPAYRNRGLVRRLFEMVHARSEAEGHLVQAITGIPYFYRQFGYEYVLDLGGHRSVHTALIPEKKSEMKEEEKAEEKEGKKAESAYALRLATLEDIPTLMRLYQQRRGSSLLWHEAGEAYWRYEIASWDDPAMQERPLADMGRYSRLWMIVDSDQQVLGYMNVAAKRWRSDLGVYGLALDTQVNWQEMMPFVLDSLREMGQKVPVVREDAGDFREITLHLGGVHPAYAVLDEAMVTRVEPPYAWYLRVPDLPAFLHKITPVLEERLAQSILTAYTGDLRFNFFRQGLTLTFEAGKLVQMAPFSPSPYGDHVQVESPPLVFLQLLFGYRSASELRATFPDVIVEPEARLLVDILFPKHHSRVSPLM